MKTRYDLGREDIREAHAERHKELQRAWGEGFSSEAADVLALEMDEKLDPRDNDHTVSEVAPVASSAVQGPKKKRARVSKNSASTATRANKRRKLDVNTDSDYEPSDRDDLGTTEHIRAIISPTPEPEDQQSDSDKSWITEFEIRANMSSSSDEDDDLD
jgi:hypothetical protein